MSTNTQNSRRDFLKTLTSGGLLLGFSWLDTDAAVPVAIADLLAAEKKDSIVICQSIQMVLSPFYHPIQNWDKIL